MKPVLTCLFLILTTSTANAQVKVELKYFDDPEERYEEMMGDEQIGVLRAQLKEAYTERKVVKKLVPKEVKQVCVVRCGRFGLRRRTVIVTRTVMTEVSETQERSLIEYDWADISEGGYAGGEITLKNLPDSAGAIAALIQRLVSPLLGPGRVDSRFVGNSVIVFNPGFAPNNEAYVVQVKITDPVRFAKLEITVKYNQGPLAPVKKSKSDSDLAAKAMLDKIKKELEKSTSAPTSTTSP